MSSTSFSLEGRFGDFSTAVLRAAAKSRALEAREAIATVPDHHACQSSADALALPIDEAQSRCLDGFEDFFDASTFTCKTEKEPLQLSIEPAPDALMALRRVICK